jgi:hypothetical protein
MLVMPSLQDAFDVAHDVHHVAVALHGKGFGHLHAAGLGDAADVVARQVDQHHMLGTLLGVVDQFDLGGLVQLGRGAARARARQRADGDFLPLGRAFLAHQNLGAGADHMAVAKVVVIHVGAGVERAQRAVQRQRRLGVALVDALADLHLHEVAPGDQLLGVLHSGQVVLLGKVALRGVALRGLHLGRADRILELLAQFAQALLAVAVGLGAGRVGIDDEVQLARQVVDDRQLLALQQQDVGHAQGVGRAEFSSFFSMWRTAS